MRQFFKILTLFFFFSNAGYSAPHVLVTLPPLHSLVTGIMKGIATPDLLLDGLTSPHHYSLKPSDYRKIEKADLIIWIGPNYEFFLEKVLQKNLDKTIQLNELSHLILLPIRSPDHSSSCSHDHGGGSHTTDPHLWLNPLNAQKFVEAISIHLSKLDPKNASSYQRNASLLITKLNHLHQNLTKKLTPVKNYPFLVFHDGYQYFEKAYNLKGLGALTSDPELPISLQKLKLLEAQIKQQKIKCIFGETQFHPPLIKTLASATKIKVGTLDPFGTIFIPDDTLYFKMMHQIADTLVPCLKREDQ